MITKARILMSYLSFCLMTLAVTLLLNCGKDKNDNPPPPAPPDTVYSNATLTGTWMMIDLPVTAGVDTISVSFKSDGNGHIVEDYDINVADLPYQYTVQANGSFTIITSNPTMTFTGMLTSATTGVITSFDNNPVTADIKKIMDLGACQGTWYGQLAVAHTNSFQIIVDNTGTITGGTGFASPMAGKLFCQSGRATGLVTTGASPPMDKFSFHSGTVVSGATATISGKYDTNSGSGTYTLTSTPTATVYSNATLTGTWMMKLNTGVDTVTSGLKFDGKGNIVEMEGADNPLSPSTFPSPYTVQSNGAFTLTWTFSSAPTMTFTGTLTSSTTGSVTAVDGSPVTGTLRQVMDLGACQGTWTGTLFGPFTNSFTIIVDNTGTITGGSGFTAPYIGKLFCESGDATGSLGTGSTYPMDWIKFQTGTVIGATVTISGNYETNSGNGTYTLTRANADNSRASGTYTFVLMTGAMNVMIGTATFNGAGGGTYVVTSPTTTSGTFSYVAKTDNSLVIDGTSFGSLRNGGSFFTVVDVLAGEEQMMVGVKQSALVTDISTTYLSGQFSYDHVAGIAEANIIQVNTATPSPGNVSFSALAGIMAGSSGTSTYTFDPTKGTISLPTPTTAADTFGAITSDRQLMIVGDGETASTSEVLGLVGLKQPGVVMSNASLNGTYLLYNIADENAGGVPFYVMGRALATFDGAGHGTFTELAKSSGTLATKPSITYAVDANGGFSINGNGSKELGTVLEDGSVFGMVWFDSTTGYASVGIGIKQ